MTLRDFMAAGRLARYKQSCSRPEFNLSSAVCFVNNMMELIEMLNLQLKVLVVNLGGINFCAEFQQLWYIFSGIDKAERSLMSSEINFGAHSRTAPLQIVPVPYTYVVTWLDSVKSLQVVHV